MAATCNSDSSIPSFFQTFALMTGGRAYFGLNDLEKGFREAVRTTRLNTTCWVTTLIARKPKWMAQADGEGQAHVECGRAAGFL